MTRFKLGRDLSGAVSYLTPISINMYNTTLATGVMQSVTVPTSDSINGRWSVIFSYASGSKVWVAVNQNAAVSGGTMAITNSDLNPVGYCDVKNGDVINFITADDGVELGVKFYVQ